MNFKSILQLARWLVSWAVATMLVGPLVFSPAPESTLTKELTLEWDVRLDHLTVMVNDWDLTEPLFWDFCLETDISQRIIVRDTYHSVREGMPVALTRQFDEIFQEVEASGSGGAWSGQGLEVEQVWGSSELEGTRVEFDWDGESLTKEFHPADKDEDQTLLLGLTEDMDLRLLLPQEKVHVGDTWEIEVSLLPDLISPGGYFAWNNELKGTAGSFGEFLDPALMGDLRHLLGEMLRGSATVTYVGEVDGVSQLSLELDVYTVQETEDLADLASRILGDPSQWWTLEVDQLEIELSLVANGTAEWDSQRGHIQGLELKGKLESSMELALVWEGDGWPKPYIIKIGTELSGEFVQHFETP